MPERMPLGTCTRAHLYLQWWDASQRLLACLRIIIHRGEGRRDEGIVQLVLPPSWNVKHFSFLQTDYGGREKIHVPPHQCIIQLINCLIFSACTKTKDTSMPFFTPSTHHNWFFFTKLAPKPKRLACLFVQKARWCLIFRYKFEPSNILCSRTEGVYLHIIK